MRLSSAIAAGLSKPWFMRVPPGAAAYRRLRCASRLVFVGAGRDSRRRSCIAEMNSGHSVFVTGSLSPDDLLQQTRWLHRLARALVADDGLAADLVQDTVVDALQQRPRGLRDLRAWLATVLRRRAARL